MMNEVDKGDGARRIAASSHHMTTERAEQESLRFKLVDSDKESAGQETVQLDSEIARHTSSDTADKGVAGIMAATHSSPLIHITKPQGDSTYAAR